MRRTGGKQRLRDRRLHEQWTLWPPLQWPWRTKREGKERKGKEPDGGRKGKKRTDGRTPRRTPPVRRVARRGNGDPAGAGNGGPRRGPRQAGSLPEGIDVHGFSAAGTAVHAEHAGPARSQDQRTKRMSAAREIGHQKRSAALAIALLHDVAPLPGRPAGGLFTLRNRGVIINIRLLSFNKHHGQKKFRFSGIRGRPKAPCR